MSTIRDEQKRRSSKTLLTDENVDVETDLMRALKIVSQSNSAGAHAYMCMPSAPFLTCIGRVHFCAHVCMAMWFV